MKFYGDQNRNWYTKNLKILMWHRKTLKNLSNNICILLSKWLLVLWYLFKFYYVCFLECLDCLIICLCEIFLRGCEVRWCSCRFFFQYLPYSVDYFLQHIFLSRCYAKYMWGYFVLCQIYVGIFSIASLYY